MLIFLLACPKPPPVVDAMAVISRDGLLDAPVITGVSAPFLESHQRVELDGAPPEELLIHTTHPRPDGAWETRLFAYSIDEAGAATPIPGEMRARGEDGRGGMQVVDLDGDGAAEIIVQGGTDGLLPRPVSIFSSQTGVMGDRVWSTSPGAEIVVADADGDGRKEVIGLTPDRGSVVVSALAEKGGVYRPAPVSGLSWLPDVLREDLAAEGGRAHPRTAHLLTLALDNGLRYRGDAALQVALEERYRAAPSRADRAVFVEAMAWAGDPGAIFFLRSVLSEPGAERPLREVARTLGMLGDQEGLTTLLEERLLAGRYDRDLFLGALEGVGPSRIAPFGRDRTIEPDVRAMLVADLFALDPAFSLIIRDLITDRSANLAAAAAAVLEEATRSSSPAAEQWLALFPPSDLVRPMKSKVVAVRRDITAVVARKDSAEAAEMLYRVLDREDDTTARRRAIKGLITQSEGVDPARHLPWLSGEVQERALHHRLIGTRGDIGVVLIGMESAVSGDDLAIYAETLAERTPDPEDDGWEDLAERVIDTAAEHPDAGMRRAAAQILGATTLAGSEEALAMILTEEADPAVLEAAVQGIGARKLVENASALVAMLPDSPATLRPALRTTLVRLGTGESVGAVAAELSAAVDEEGDAVVLPALEQTAGIDVVRGHVKALIAADPVDCGRAGAALLSLVRAGDGATDDVVADLTAACPDDLGWLEALFAVWAADPLLKVQIRPFRDHPDRAIRVAAEQALSAP